MNTTELDALLTLPRKEILEYLNQNYRKIKRQERMSAKQRKQYVTIRDVVCRNLDVEPDAVKIARRFGDIVQARKFIVHFVRQYTNIPDRLLAEQLSIDRSTVAVHSKQMRWLTRKDTGYRLLSETIDAELRLLLLSKSKSN